MTEKITLWYVSNSNTIVCTSDFKHQQDNRAKPWKHSSHKLATFC